jgi:Flp pilus assembly protein TadG
MKRNRENIVRRGVIAVLAAFVMMFVMIMTAFVTDLGYVMVQKTDLQAAVDAAAMAGVMDLSDEEQTVLEASLDEYLVYNDFDPSVVGITRTIEYGTWDEDAGTFVVDAYANANSLHLHVQTDVIPSIFGSVMGHDAYSTSAESIVVLSKGPPRDVVLVLDCSDSMNANMSNGDSRVENTVVAAQSLIANLTDEDRVGLAVYSWKDTDRNKLKKTGKIETPLSFNPMPTATVVSGLTHKNYTGGTNIGGGFRAGLDVFLNDPSPRDSTTPELVKMIVMMTDGNVNKAEPYPTNEGPTGVLPPGPYNPRDYDDDDAMTKWANTIKARGIKIYAVRLHGSSQSDFTNTASTPDSYDDQYFFHIASGSEDVSNLLNTYKKIGFGNRGPKIVN